MATDYDDIYNTPREALGDAYPVGATESAWQTLEPLLTPDQLKAFHLFGIPLVSVIKNPITKTHDVMTNDMLKEYIIRATKIAEAETGLTFMPLRIEERQPFDRAEFQSYGYFRTRQKPVATVEALTITPANDINIFSVPPAWIEGGYLQYGQVNIFPIAISLTGGNPTAQMPFSNSGGGALFMSMFGNQPWLPAFFKIKYTAGFKDGKVPTIVNELVGTIAAMEVLSMLATTHAQTSSASLSLDGVSQSVSSPGPQLYQVRMEELDTKKKSIIGKLKALYGLSIIVGNV